MYKNIILTGFMGVGKTSVGIGLAKELGYTFVDTDNIIEADEKTAITEIFAKRGEPYFRDVETRVIRRVMEGEGQVVSTGGGAVIRDENREAFRFGGLTVCLTGRPEVIFDRIKHETHRPLLQVNDPLAQIRELLESRETYYRLADMTIDTSDKSVKDIIAAIKERVKRG
ncbi:MAG TPA: shikimate kinase [Nitrospiraceae bacterium]|nr:shikimate kinase [Nitrospiraceae bacterium]